MLYTLTVGLGNASRRFSGTLNSKSRQGQSSCQRRRSQKSSRACLFAGRPWQFAGKTLIPYGRASDQIEIFSGHDLPEIPTFSLLQSSSILVIVLTRAAPTLQYHFLLFFFFEFSFCSFFWVFLLFFFFWVGLVVYSCVIFLLCCYGIAAQFFGFSNCGSQNTTSVQDLVLGSAWGFFFLALWFNLGFVCSSRSRRSRM